MEFSRQEHWRGLPFPSPGWGVGGIFLNQGSNLGLLHCRQILHHLSHQATLKRRLFLLRRCCHPQWDVTWPAGSGHPDQVLLYLAFGGGINVKQGRAAHPKWRFMTTLSVNSLAQAATWAVTCPPWRPYNTPTCHHGGSCWVANRSLLCPGFFLGRNMVEEAHGGLTESPFPKRH